MKKLLEQEIAQTLKESTTKPGEFEYQSIQLSELQNVNLLKNFVSKSLIMEASKDITINSSDLKSVKFSDMLGGKRRLKKSIGAGEFDKYSISKPITKD